MVQICPISHHQIDENVTRVNALITFLVSVTFLFFQSPILMFLLSIDFLLRAYFNGKFSVVKISSRFVVNKLNTKPILINEGPKVFAARIGTLMTFLIIVFGLFQLNAVANILALTLGVFAFLEFSVGYCVACKLYPYVMNLQSKLVRTNG